MRNRRASSKTSSIDVVGLGKDRVEVPLVPYRARVRVRSPYRLDFTVDALRRVRENVVDIMSDDGRYLRAMANDDGVNIVEVRQLGGDELDLHITGRHAKAQVATVSRMLGFDVDLRRWYERAKNVPWIDRLAEEFRGLRPPRYPDLWEALCHGIVFQQLSIQAGAAIMLRLVERFSEPVQHDGVRLYPFPRAQTVAEATTGRLQSVGLSRMKALYIQDAARATVTNSLATKAIERLSTEDAAKALCGMRGIGPWSAAIILLRGFGRLDAFPLGDTGVARGLKTFAVERPDQIADIFAALGDTRGMLYFHLLLARRMAAARD